MPKRKIENEGGESSKKLRTDQESSSDSVCDESLKESKKMTPLEALDTPEKADLDSDDDQDDTDNKDDSSYRLRNEDILGQEEGGPSNEEGVQVTPFNMAEELEEGHFDKEGMYIFHKEKEIKDNWLENIDWAGIKKKEVPTNQSSSDSDDDESIAIGELYKQILNYLKPGENINKALKRLAENKSLSASERLKLKKAGQLEKALSERNPAALIELTELGNKILRKTGNMDVYEEYYEVIKSKASIGQQPVPSTGLDMFADDFQTKEKKHLDNPSSEPTVSEESEVQWELKKSAESEEIEGPITSEKMLEMSQTGKLAQGALVRKVGTREFYSAARIDFDLYL